MSAIEIKAATGDAEAWGEYDGRWTLFNIQIGDDTTKQTFRAVPGTSSYSTWLPANGSCASAAAALGTFTVNDCAVGRGIGLLDGTQSGGYVGTSSESYRVLGISSVDLGSHLQPATLFGTGYNVDADAGLDFVSVQAGNNTFVQAAKNTTIFSDNSSFYMLPTLGLGLGEWLSPTGVLVPSFLKTLADNATIPSRSWGYTAGAAYSESHRIS